MYFTYILYSVRLNKFYIGYTSNIAQRIRYHNAGRVNFTSKGVPWHLKYFEEGRSYTQGKGNKKPRKAGNILNG